MSVARDRSRWTLAIFAFAAMSGVALQARGALFLSFQETFGVSEAQLGLVTPAGTLGFILVLLTVGVLAGRLDIHKWFLIGAIGTGVAFLLIGLAPSFIVLLAVFFARNAATGVIHALDKPVLSHFYPGSRGRLFNLHTMVWAAGATLGPLLVTAVLYLTDWRYTYVILAIALLPVVFLIWRLHVPSLLDNEQPLRRPEVRGILKHPEIVVMLPALVLIGGVESVFFTWLPFYASQFFSPGIANAALSVFLVSYVPGRLMFSHLVSRFRYLSVVLWGTIAMTATIAVTLRFAGQTEMFVGIFFTGFLLSGLLPTLLAWGVDVVPEFTGPVNAFALTASQAGFFVFPPIVGVLAEWYSIEQAMALQLGLVLALIVVVAFGGRYASRASA